MGGTGYKRGGAKLVHFAEGHGAYLPENQTAKVTAKARNYFGSIFSSEDNRHKSDKRDYKHIKAVLFDVFHIRKINAIINYVAHYGGEHKIADCGNGH